MAEEKEDRISALPDSIIQHILSFLPSTKEAIQTTLLSKSFHNQWTRVPILKFDSSGMSAENFFRLIDNTLLQYDCPKIQKFHLRTHFKKCDGDRYWDEKIRFAVGKDAKELFLKFYYYFWLPESLFEHASLVKLHMSNCVLSSMPKDRRVDWGQLKALHLEQCRCPDRSIENILRWSPSLESLAISDYFFSREDIIASQSLKKLVLDRTSSSYPQISCPNLKELKISNYYFHVRSVPKLMNAPSLICATLDLMWPHEHFIIKIIEQLQHVKELKISSPILSCLSKKGVAPSFVLLNNKLLTLDSSDFREHSDGIAWALRSSHVLEKLVIKLYMTKRTTYRPKFFPDNYWSSNKTVFNCLKSHLKTVEINGLSEDNDDYKLVLNFVKFLLKNSTVLEKLIVIVKGGRKKFVTKVSQKLSKFERFSQDALVKLFCSK